MGIRMIFESGDASIAPEVANEKKRLVLNIGMNNGLGKSTHIVMHLDKKTAIRLTKHLRSLISEMED